MLITMTALGTAMIDDPLDWAVGPGAIAIGAGEGAFFGGDGTARVIEETRVHSVELMHHLFLCTSFQASIDSYKYLYIEYKFEMRLHSPGGGVSGAGTG